MAQFEATVRLFELAESDAAAARHTIETRLRSAGFTRWHIVSVGAPGTLTRTARSSRRPVRVEVSYAGGGLLVAAIVAWALWFLYLLTG